MVNMVKQNKTKKNTFLFVVLTQLTKLLINDFLSFAHLWVLLFSHHLRELFYFT